MGVYLSEPNKNKTTNEGSSQALRFVAAEMQGFPPPHALFHGFIGWRSHMEDAHISEPSLSVDAAIFGVFDGHGGK